MNKKNIYQREDCLPLNRKEQYYTGTVLPGIIFSDKLQRFLELTGQHNHNISLEPETTNVQFFTEYNLFESAFTNKDLKRNIQFSKSHDTPDIVIFIDTAPRCHLLIIEAKMFSRPSAAGLAAQISRQKEGCSKPLISMLEAMRDLPVELQHFALVPKGYSCGNLELERGDAFKVIHWEDIADRYADVEPAGYWIAILRQALVNYSTLSATSSPSGQYSTAKLTGLEIVAKQHTIRHVGRFGGLHGTEFKLDIKSGDWRNRRYEVIHKEPKTDGAEAPSRNFSAWKTSSRKR